MSWTELAEKTQRRIPSYHGFFVSPKMSTVRPIVSPYAKRRDTVRRNPTPRTVSFNTPVYRDYDDIRNHAIQLLTNVALSI